jgi:hypothetical protein
MGRDAARPEKSRSSTVTSARGRVVVHAGHAQWIDGGNPLAGLILQQTHGVLARSIMANDSSQIGLCRAHDDDTLLTRRLAGEH